MHALNTKSLMLATLLCLCLLCNVSVWTSVRPVKARWMNVPPVPSYSGAKAAGLGDAQVAYRTYGIMIQNFGDTAGRVTPLKDYDFEALGNWFMLEHILDPRSNFAPTLAAFVFSASQDPNKIGPLIDYLEKAAGEGEGNKWRWLAQAVHLARFKEKNMSRALTLASKLAAIYRPDMPLWVKQMPIFVTTESGDKKAALGMMLAMIESEIGKVPPQEINAMTSYVCQSILTKEEAATNKLCTSKAFNP